MRNLITEIETEIKIDEHLRLSPRPTTLKQVLSYKGSKLSTVEGLDLEPREIPYWELSYINGALENLYVTLLDSFIRKIKKRGALGILRFIVNKKGRMLVWNAEEAIHRAVGNGEGWTFGSYTRGDLEKNDMGWVVLIKHRSEERENLNEFLMMLKKDPTTTWRDTSQ